eukprot:SAG25_NODE_236_length_11287_cov_246.398999_8_plen_84_part_00
MAQPTGELCTYRQGAPERLGRQRRTRAHARRRHDLVEVRGVGVGPRLRRRAIAPEQHAGRGAVQPQRNALRHMGVHLQTRARY